MRLRSVAAVAAFGLVLPVLPALAGPAQAVDITANPTISNSCGLDATLVLDASGSISSSNAVEKVRSAGEAFLDALKDTKSTARLTQFASMSEQLASRQIVDGASMAPGGAFAKGIAGYYNPKPAIPAGWSVTNGGSTVNGPTTTNNQWTNWEQSLSMAGAEPTNPEIIVYVTDGDPTAYDRTYNGKPNVLVNQSSTGPALSNAIVQANTAKGRGTRMLAVGVGSAVTSGSSVTRLTQISGPQVVRDAQLPTIKDINQIDVAIVTDFDKLAQFLHQVVSELCTPSMTIRKYAQTPGDASYTPAAGWNMTVAPGAAGGQTWVLPPAAAGSQAPTWSDPTGADGYAQFQWYPNTAGTTSNASVTETLRPGYIAGRPGANNDWRCELRTPDSEAVRTVTGEFTNPGASPSFQLDVGSRNIVTCSLYNSFIYSPALTIVKSAQDNPVRGNAAGWDEQYTFVVTNTGNTPLSGVHVDDPRCDVAITPATVDLAIGGQRTFTCSKSHIQVGTTDQPVTVTNTATATGQAPDGSFVNDTDSVNVDVKTPALAIAKTAYYTGKGTEKQILPGDEVPAGVLVTYRYAVSNTGNDVLSAPTVTDDKCTPVASVPNDPPNGYNIGDSNSNDKLDLDETWQFDCSTNLYSDTTNTADAQANWSGYTPTGQNNGPVTDEDSMTVDVNVHAQLTVFKVVNDTTPAANFGFTATGAGISGSDGSFILNPNGTPSVGSNELDIVPLNGNSQYVITESSIPAGWALTDLDCSGMADQPDYDLAAGTVTLDIRAGERVNCRFVDELLPRVTVTKVTNEPLNTNTFGFIVSQPTQPDQTTDPDLGHGDSQTFTVMPVTQASETVTITEGELSGGWSLQSIDCGDADVTADTANRAVAINALDYGDEVECVFANVRAASTITVVKTSDPADANGTDFGFVVTGPGAGTFSLSPTGQADSHTTEITPTPAEDSISVISENGPPTGWTLASASCTDGQAVEEAVGGAVAITWSGQPTAWTCTFHNVQDASLVVIKRAPDAAALGLPSGTPLFPFVWDAGTPAQFNLGPGEFKAQSGLAAASYTVTELDPGNPDWYIVGGEPACFGTAAEPSYSPGAATVNIAAGEAAHCVFTNAFDFRPDLSLVKTVDRDTIIAGSATIPTYTYVVTNTGNVPLVAPGTIPRDPKDVISDVVVPETDPPTGCTDIQAADGVNLDEPLAVGSSWTFTCQPGTQLTADTLNVAVATLVEPAQGTEVTGVDEAEVTVLDPAILVLKSPDAPLVYSGTTVTYTYEVINTGQTSLMNIALDDDKCENITGDDPGILHPGESALFTCQMTLTQDTTNIVTATADPTLDEAPGAPSVSDEDQATVEVLVGDITITKTPTAPKGVMHDGKLIVPAGTTVTYQYAVTSGTANTPMDVLSIEDDKCSPIIQTMAGAYNVGDTNANGMVDPGETWRATCQMMINGVQDIVNTVVVTADEPRIPSPPFTDSATAEVMSVDSGIKVVKSASDAIVAPGTTITYTYVVTNTGQTPLHNVTVVDDKCAPTSYVSGDTTADGLLDTTEAWQYTCATAITEATTNVVTATGIDPSGEPVIDTSTANVRVTAVEGLSAAVKVAKTAFPLTIDPGGAVTYTYQVSNAGDLALKLTITDDKCAPVTYVSGDTNGDGLLNSPTEPDEKGSYEVWTYTCTTHLATSTTNTVVVSGVPTVNGKPVGAAVSDLAQARVTVTGGGGGNGGDSCGSSEPGSDCNGLYPPVPLKVSAKKASSSVARGKWVSRITSVKAAKGDVSVRILCKNAKGKSVTGCAKKVKGSKYAVSVKVTKCQVRKVTLTVMAKPKAAYLGQYRTNFWVRTWKVKACG